MMTIEDFIQFRGQIWQKLERLLDVAERSPETDLGHERIREIVQLYREACSDLNQARSLTANPDILERLNQLTGRAYRFIYRGGGARSGGSREKLKDLFFRNIPATFQKERFYIFAAFLAMFSGTVFGFAAVMINPTFAEALVPEQFFRANPLDSVNKIETGAERVDSTQEALMFGARLYVNNIQVTFLAFTLCALTIVLGLAHLFWTGVFLGALAAFYFLHGVEVHFLAWVGPHGSLELPAIIFGAAAGLRVGHAVLLPGEVTRESAIREAFPSAWRMMLFAMLILVVAGLIEGSFSQFSSRIVSYPVKIAVSVIIFATLTFYLFMTKPRAAGSVTTATTTPALGGPRA